MNNKRQRNRLFTMLMLVMSLFIPQWGWAQTAIQPKEGDGTAENPYQITSAEELLWFANNVGNNNGNNACAKLMNNISLSNVCHAAGDGKEEYSWDSFSYSYGGTFDGNGMTLSDLYVKDNYWAGLFSYVGNGSCIKNLTIENAVVTTNNVYNPAGILAVEVWNSTIQNVKVCAKSNITATGSWVGGLVGRVHDNSLIINCENKAIVNGFGSVGGICGESGLTVSIKGCANYGSVIGSSDQVGGICGQMNRSTIIDCANYAEIKGNGYVGGIVGGENEGTIKNVFGYGNVQGKYSCGIVAGNCHGGTASGLVAYNNEATIISDGLQQENAAIGYANDFTGITTGYSKEMISKGIVAFLLQQRASEEILWGQDLSDSSKPYPILGSADKVYAKGNVVYTCTGDFVSGTLTNNLSSAEGIFKENHGNAITHDAVKAGCVTDGTKLYYECDACHKSFEDPLFTREMADVTDYAQGHDYYGESDVCSKCKEEIIEVTKGNTNLSIDKAVGVQTDIKSYKLFKYIASETGTLEVMSFSRYPIYPYTYGTLWDSKKSTLLASNFRDENDTNNGNFKITYNVEKDKTYYIGVRSSNGDALTDNYVLNVKFNGLDVDLPEDIYGKGTAEEPFELNTAEHLKWFADYVNGENGNIYHPETCARLTDDIDMSSVCHAAGNGEDEESWTPISNSDWISWCGTFDGNDKTISNLYVNITTNNSGRYAGLFGKINRGGAKNVIFKNAKIIVGTQYYYAGILAGMVSRTTIQGITTDTESLVGNDNGEYSECTGGIVGRGSNATILYCENHAKVTGNTDVGGICGYFDSDYDVAKTIKGCANYGLVTGTGRIVGGVVGLFERGIVEDCANYAAIKSSSYTVGGIAGFSNSGSRFKNVFSNGDVTGVTSASDEGEKVGLIVGYSYTSYGDGLIAYGKESTLTINGKKVEVRAVGYDPQNSVVNASQAFTNDEIKSGKVAYLLNNEVTDGTQAWYQKLGNNGDAWPVLKSTGNNTVYEVCRDGQTDRFYSNDNPTGIEDVYVATDRGVANGIKQGIYDLQGRKLSQEPKSGIYIKDGKKYVK